MHTVASRKMQQGGYTLLQVSAALLVLGLLAAPMGGLYYLYQKDRKLDLNFRAVEQAVSILQNFRSNEGYYPCPAPLDAARTDPAHGHPSNCRSGAIAAAVPGTCVDGICVEESIRTDIANRRVVVGAVPFRLLQLPEARTIDAYGSRLLYVVTESMTDTSSINDASGGVAVRDESNTPLTTPDGSAAFLILSHGPNRIGGYSADGALIRPCAGAGLDRENCAQGTPESIYIAALQSDAVGPAAFDDVISYYSQISPPVWKRTAANPEHIEDLSNRFVGVGAPLPATELDIAATGDALGAYGTSGTDGIVMTDLVCDAAGGNCFDPTIIGGEIASGGGMDCPPGQHMTGIEGGAPKCEFLAVLCPPSTPILVGRNADGTPRCRAIPEASCPATPMTLCSPDDVSLTAQASGYITPTGSIVRGDCRSRRYRCSNGVWSVYSSGGHCSFTPITTTNPANACGDGYTGTYTTTSTTLCTGGTTTTSTFASDCTCVGGVYTDPESCSAILGPGYIGTATRTRTYTPPSCALTTSGWDTSACACDVPAVTTRWVNAGTCPLGFIGGPIQKEQAFNAATCGWEDTGNIDNPCTCNTTPQYANKPHVCSNPVCELPNPADPDIWRTDIDPATCTALPEVLDTAGSCLPKTFTWVQTGVVGTPKGSALTPSDAIVGDSCTCAQHVATSGAPASCWYPAAIDPGLTTYSCSCQ